MKGGLQFVIVTFQQNIKTLWILKYSFLCCFFFQLSAVIFARQSDMTMCSSLLFSSVKGNEKMKSE